MPSDTVTSALAERTLALVDRRLSQSPAERQMDHDTNG